MQSDQHPARSNMSDARLNALVPNGSDSSIWSENIKATIFAFSKKIDRFQYLVSDNDSCHIFNERQNRFECDTRGGVFVESDDGCHRRITLSG